MLKKEGGEMRVEIVEEGRVFELAAAKIKEGILPIEGLGVSIPQKEEPL